MTTRNHPPSQPPSRPRRPTSDRRFDLTSLTPADHALLARFSERRAAFERAIAASNVLHHKHTCPACGFPTLDQRHEYAVCVLCLWEDGGGEADPTQVAPPNPIALIAARRDIAGLLADFEQTHTIDDSLAAVVAAIKRFEADLQSGAAQIDREDFAAHLRRLLPTAPR